jgi:hypothetical protein
MGSGSGASVARRRGLVIRICFIAMPFGNDPLSIEAAPSPVIGQLADSGQLAEVAQ